MVTAFRTPAETIGPLEADASALLLASAADLALVLDGDDRIIDMAVQPTDLSLEIEGFGRWLGRRWAETVAPENRGKVETLFAEGRASGASDWRQLVHPTASNRAVPILYRVVRLNRDGDKLVAIGRDLRSVSALQQRLVDAQLSMERDYAKLRSAETRYRLLFQASSEPVVVLDGANHRLLEANPAAIAMLERDGRRAMGRLFADLVEPGSRDRVQALLGDLRSPSRINDVEVRLLGGLPATLHATPFRQDAATLTLVQVLAPSLALPNQVAAEATFTDFAQAAPDGFVMTDAAGRVLDANLSFLELAQLPDLAAARGELLDSWFGRTEVDFDVFMANLRGHGSVRLFSTSLRGTQGALVDVEVSAAAIGERGGKRAIYGLAIRDVGRRLSAARSTTDLPHSAAQLTELIGRVPLKDLVRETTDVIEKLCIEAALELTNDNRASAAEVLGLSRQSLYVKLRRFGFADAGLEGEA